MVHRAPPVPPVLCSGTLGNSVSLYVKHLNTLCTLMLYAFYAFYAELSPFLPVCTQQIGCVRKTPEHPEHLNNNNKISLMHAAP